MAINKRFPANTTLDYSTFLNNKKVDGELYAYLQSISQITENKETVVYKTALPKQTFICSILGIKSPKTYRAHLNYLIEQGYVVETEDKYYLPNQEEIYFLIPLQTLKFLNDTMTEQVIKIYIYLGQRWKYKQNYVFTAEEIGKHIGIALSNHMRNYEIINNALTCLYNNGLITYEEFYGEDKKLYKKLTQFSLEYTKPQVLTHLSR